MKTGYLAERSKQLQLAALSIAQGMQAGSFRSHFRGRGIEFDALREYEAGDDIRSIDWNLMARSGKTFVKLYREERDMRLFFNCRCVGFDGSRQRCLFTARKTAGSGGLDNLCGRTPA